MIRNGIEYDDFDDFAASQADPVRCERHGTVIYSPVTGADTPCDGCEAEMVAASAADGAEAMDIDARTIVCRDCAAHTVDAETCGDCGSDNVIPYTEWLESLDGDL